MVNGSSHWAAKQRKVSLQRDTERFIKSCRKERKNIHNLSMEKKEKRKNNQKQQVQWLSGLK